MIRLFKIYLTLAFLLVTTFCMAQKSELKFSKDGKFKIVQFTDVHFKYGNRASDIALERINQVLDDERPDLVIFTGDVVYSAPADSGMLQVLEPVVKRKLPFVVTFGNHDNEQGMTREQLYDIIRIDSEIVFQSKEGCCFAILHGFSLLFSFERCEGVCMAYIRPDKLVSSTECGL